MIDFDESRSNRLKSLSPRKRLGAWYTPDELASCMTRWALAARPGPLLDPSFGGCSFLRAGLAELNRLGVRRAGKLLVGVDLDRVGTAPEAQHLVEQGVPAENFVYSDFLAAPSLPIRHFQAVVGNPPYVRHHWHASDWRASARAAVATAGATLPNRASTWAYFTVYSSCFVRPGGRMAFVLPGAVLQADYATNVMDYLRGRFAKIRLVRLGNRVFDADEQSVLLLAGDRCSGGVGSLLYDEVEEPADLPAALERAAVAPLRAAGSRYKHAALPEEAAALLDDILDDRRTCRLDSKARVRLGIVTGANEFFVRPLSEMRGGVGITRRKVVPSSRWLKSARWTPRDLQHVERAGHPTRMLYISASAIPEDPLAADISAAEHNGLAARSHLRRRKPWYALRDRETPDAMLPYMGAEARGVTLNDARCVCTNAIHRLFWNDELDEAAVAGLIVSSWSSIFAFAAELYGRHYGGGVLKLELRDAQRLPVLNVALDPAAVGHVDALLRNEGVRNARLFADQAVGREALGLTEEEIGVIRSSAAALRTRRLSTKASQVSGEPSRHS